MKIYTTVQTAITTTLMTNLLLWVAMMSLVVGGVGIMNIMLVSVTERTREIGLRMAVGARARDILWQFMEEAVTLCLVGGALGIVLGHGGSYLVWLSLRWPVETSPLAVAAAVLVSGSVGMVFGFYPAGKPRTLIPSKHCVMSELDPREKSVSAFAAAGISLAAGQRSSERPTGRFPLSLPGSRPLVCEVFPGHSSFSVLRGTPMAFTRYHFKKLKCCGFL